MATSYTHMATLSSILVAMERRDFATWFQRQLRLRDWTQADFVRRSGAARGTVSNWARGSRLPDPAGCDLIADVLGVDRDEVLAIAGHRTPDEELAPDDPRRDLFALMKRVKMTPERTGTIQTLLEKWRGDDLAGRTPK